MKKENIRESNFELLRIIAIIMIIIHHLFYHCINPHVLSNCSNINNILFYKRLILTDFGALIGKVGNVIFLLISGYFLCGKPNIDISKQIKKIIMQLIYVSLLLVIMSTIYYCYINKTTSNIILIDIINNNDWWFIGYYILIIIIGYLFLNKYISSLDRNKYRNLILSLFAIITLTFSREIFSGLSSKLPILLTGIFLYCLGGYINKYNIFNNYKTITIVLIMLLILGVIILSYNNRVNNNINSKSVYVITQNIIYSEYSIMAISLGVCIFELFRRIKIKRNKIINFIASSCFIIYLIHDNSFTKYLYNLPNWCYLYKNNMLAFICALFSVTVLIFIIGLYAYILYFGICKIADSKRFKALFLKKC